MSPASGASGWNKGVGTFVVDDAVVDLVGQQQQAVPRATSAMRSSSARGYTAPVGLFGLISTIARVRGVTSASISSGSGRKALSALQR